MYLGGKGGGGLKLENILGNKFNKLDLRNLVYFIISNSLVKVTLLLLRFQDTLQCILEMLINALKSPSFNRIKLFH